MRAVLLTAVLALAIAPASAAACSYALGPASGTFAENPGPDEQQLPPPSEDDASPPSAATIADVAVQLVMNPLPASGAGCPSLDSLQFHVLGNDDLTLSTEMFVAAYVAPDVEALAAKTSPDLYLRLDPYGLGYQGGGAPKPAPTGAEVTPISITLGQSMGRQRDGAPFRSPEPFCFAVALRDRAGQLGTRSEPVCLDTTDEHGRYARRVDAAPSGCGGLGLGLVPASLVFAVMLGGRRLRRRGSIVNAPR